MVIFILNKAEQFFWAQMKKFGEIENSLFQKKNRSIQSFLPSPSWRILPRGCWALLPDQFLLTNTSWLVPPGQPWALISICFFCKERGDGIISRAVPMRCFYRDSLWIDRRFRTQCTWSEKKFMAEIFRNGP